MKQSIHTEVPQSGSVAQGHQMSSVISALGREGWSTCHLVSAGTTKGYYPCLAVKTQVFRVLICPSNMGIVVSVSSCLGIYVILQAKCHYAQIYQPLAPTLQDRQSLCSLLSSASPSTFCCSKSGLKCSWAQLTKKNGSLPSAIIFTSALFYQLNKSPDSWRKTIICDLSSWLI